MDIEALHRRWEALGVDVVKADLISGARRYVGGSPELREEAWRWVRKKEEEAKKIFGSTISCCGVTFNWRVFLKLLKNFLLRHYARILSKWRS